MSPWQFLAAAGLLAAMGIVHSVLGERFILQRLGPLPKILGDDTFTRATLRFVWHALSFAWWAIAVLLAFTPPEAEALIGWTVLVALAITSITTIITSRARHLSWVVEWVVIVLLLLAL